MYKTIWHYQINPEYRREFYEYYKTDGYWALLFKKAEVFINTELYKIDGKQDIFITIDYWLNEDFFKAFKRDYKSDYEELDKKCEKFTILEVKLL